MLLLLFDSPLWFYLFLTVLIIADIVALESDHGWVATVGFIIFSAFIMKWGDVSPLFNWLTASPWNFLGSIAGYLVMSILWGGLLEWKLHLKRRLIRYKEARLDWLIKQGVTRVTLETQVPLGRIPAWKEQRRGVDETSWRIPAKNKGKIIKNMTWWPVAMLRTFFREPFIFMYNQIGEWLLSMSDRAIKKSGIDSDLS